MVRERILTVARTIDEAREVTRGWRAQGRTYGLVPTMGWLHDGHLALVARAQAENERVLATIFVNPLQFGPAEDFGAYPRDEARDFAILRDHDCDAVFAPTPSDMFPDGPGSIENAPTRVSVNALASLLCGRERPGHFDGVATIVLKLLMITLPDIAYFGEKDYQQLTVIRRLVRDLNVPVTIRGVPIVREPDGLAMSSRNVYLSARERAIAPELHRVLQELRASVTTDGVDIDSTLTRARDRLIATGFDRVDYLTLASGETLETLRHLREGARLFAAAWLGRTRLIDNIAVHEAQFRPAHICAAS